MERVPNLTTSVGSVVIKEDDSNQNLSMENEFNIQDS